MAAPVTQAPVQESESLQRAGIGNDAVAAWHAAAPRDTGDFSGDCARYSRFWESSDALLARLPAKPARDEQQTAAAERIKQVAREARTRFLHAHVEAVYDRLTGKPLAFDVVPDTLARAGGVDDAEPDTSYIRINLARPVPPEGETRLLILKTYRDPKSYWREGDTIVFSRSLSIKRNAIVLPAGYELVACNMPAQVLADPDGRLLVSFMNPGPAEAPLVLKARRLRR